MAKPSEGETSLTAAECAARTGLTVRALHVYERYGLITPNRTAKGWRLYLRQDIDRLNVITALKAIGLSLSQIRDIVRAKPPSLDRILELQVETWRARKSEVERGLALAEAALAQVRARQSLTTEDLCDLILNSETVGLRRVIEEVLEDQFTPAEHQRLMTWSKEHWPDSDTYAEAFIETRAAAWKLVAAGVEPSSPEAQTFIDRMMGHERMSLIFERLRRGAGSILNASKGQAVAKALVKRMGRGSVPHNYLAAELFIDSARQVLLERSAEWRPFAVASGELVADLRRLIETQADPSSPEARKMLDRFAAIGRNFPLGDPVFYALWAHEKGLARKDMWEFIGRAEQAHGARTNN